MKHLAKILAWAGIDLNGTELQNVTLQNLGTDPTSPAPAEGRIYYDTVNHTVKVRNHSSFGHIGDGCNAATLGGNLPTAFASTIHNLVDTTNHPVSGLTSGHYMKALTATSFGFAALPAASTSAAGIVQLEDGLASTSTELALTAAQGKALQDGKVAKISGGTSGNLVSHNAAGVLADSGLKLNDSGSTTTDIWSASKVNTVINNASLGVATALHAPVADLAAAKAITSGDRSDKMLINIETLGLYRFDAESAVVSNDDQIIRPTDVADDATAGRWIKLSSSINNHNSFASLDGGSTGQYYHLTSAQHTALTAISGLATNAPAAPGTAAVGTATLVAREDHAHAKQVGFSHIHVLNDLEVDVTNSPFTPSDGVGAVTLKQGNNITMTQDANGVVTITATGAGTINKFAIDVGNGIATDIIVTHSLNSRDVGYHVYLNSGTYEEVIVDCERTSVNTITLKFAVAPTSAQYRCVVIG